MKKAMTIIDLLFPSRRIIHELEKQNMNLTNLTAAVNGVSASIDAAVAALGNANNQGAIDALTTQLNDMKAKLDAAVALVTPTPPSP